MLSQLHRPEDFQGGLENTAIDATWESMLLAGSVSNNWMTLQDAGGLQIQTYRLRPSI